MGALHFTTMYYGTLYGWKQLELMIFILLCEVIIQWAVDFREQYNTLIQVDLNPLKAIPLFVDKEYEEVYSYLTFIYHMINVSI